MNEEEFKNAVTTGKNIMGNTSFNMRFFENHGGDIGEMCQYYESSDNQINEHNSIELKVLANFLRTFRNYEWFLRQYNDEFLGGSKMTPEDVLFCVIESVQKTIEEVGEGWIFHEEVEE